MTKVALFIPTYRHGGLDVVEASLRRQTIKPDLLIVADQIYGRQNIWDEIVDNVEIQYWNIQANAILLKPGYKRTLCASYNWAAELSIYEKCDLLISLQDYIWIPENGIERFIKVHEANPTALITGMTDISKDPSPDNIYDINGLRTIFFRRYGRKPEVIEWRDSRREIYHFDNDGDIYPIYPEHWEANWAAVPVSKFKEGCFWDEDFDKGIAYENMDFAKTCREKTGSETLLDIRNEAISLPHKDYFKGEREEIEQFSNRWRFESKWGI